MMNVSIAFDFLMEYSDLKATYLNDGMTEITRHLFRNSIRQDHGLMLAFTFDTVDNEYRYRCLGIASNESFDELNEKILYETVRESLVSWLKEVVRTEGDHVTLVRYDQTSKCIRRTHADESILEELESIYHEVSEEKEMFIPLRQYSVTNHKESSILDLF